MALIDLTMQCWWLRIRHEWTQFKSTYIHTYSWSICIIMASRHGCGVAEAAQAAPFWLWFFAYINFELPRALARLCRQCTLTQSECIVNGLPRPDKLLAALIMFTSEKNFSYPTANNLVHISDEYLSTNLFQVSSSCQAAPAWAWQIQTM